MNDPIVVVGIARTAIGSMGGVLAEVSAPTLGAEAIKGALADANLNALDIDEVYMGCVLSAGLGQAPARQAALAAGLSQSVSTTTVNKVCGSGMKAVMLAADAVTLGRAKVVVAGGMENMSGAPYLLTKARAGYRLGHGELLDHMFLDGLQNAYDGNLMGVFAEATAEKLQFSREKQDEFAISSLMKACRAMQEGYFEREITPIKIKNKKGDIIVSVDEQPSNAKPERISALNPAFKKDGTVTAANSSSISDGAAALILMRASTAKNKGLKPLAEIKAHTQYAQSPEWFTTAPVGAVKSLLSQTHWSMDDVDLFEINEAFAVVAMAVAQELNIPEGKLNIHGGACALGHPLGASGARILVTLIAALQTYGKKKGIASLCIGGGEATAIAVELL